MQNRQKSLLAGNPKFKHGDSVASSEHHYLYKALDSIQQRCLNPNNHNYKRYGARGINMCETFSGDYLAFKSYILENIGDRPTLNHSIDRIDNNKGYFQGNLKWSTMYEQSVNRRNSKLSTEDVAEIRFLLSLGYSGAAIGRDYGVLQNHISRIKTGARH